MPSIFIWKATTSVHTSSTVLHYSGANWFLEEHHSHSYSYQYENQVMLPNEVIAYQAVKMPQDWVGSEILETVTVNYQLIRDDSNGTLEQIGEWMRYRSKHDSAFECNALESEYSAIHSSRPISSKPISSKPISSKPISSKPIHRKCNDTRENEVCLIRFHGIS